MSKKLYLLLGLVVVITLLFVNAMIAKAMTDIFTFALAALVAFVTGYIARGSK